jgi:excisionase family DNA binding protein
VRHESREDTTVTTKTTSSRPPLIGVADVAEMLGVEVRHIRRLVYERRIPFVKWGHLIRFDPREVDAWIGAHSIPAEQSLRGASARPTA